MWLNAKALGSVSSLEITAFLFWTNNVLVSVSAKASFDQDFIKIF